MQRSLHRPCRPELITYHEHAVHHADFTLADLNTALNASGAPEGTSFNTTPPQLFAILHDTKNGTIFGFVFDANAEPTLPPVVKGAAASMRPCGAAFMLALVAVIISLA